MATTALLMVSGSPATAQLTNPRTLRFAINGDLHYWYIPEPVVLGVVNKFFHVLGPRDAWFQLTVKFHTGIPMYQVKYTTAGKWSRDVELPIDNFFRTISLDPCVEP